MSSASRGRITPQEYLTQAHSRWRGLPAAELAELGDEERTGVRQLEAQAAQLEFAALADIILPQQIPIRQDVQGAANRPAEHACPAWQPQGSEQVKRP